MSLFPLGLISQGGGAGAGASYLGRSSDATMAANGSSLDAVGSLLSSYDYNSSGSNYSAALSKFNSSGTLVFTRTLIGDKATKSDAIGGIYADSSNNIYVAGRTSKLAGGVSGFLVKYNSTGTIQWQRDLHTQAPYTNYSINFRDCVTDSSGNVYTIGTYQDNAGNIRAHLAKYNSSGTFQWESNRTNGSNNENLNSIAIDSSGNIYGSGYAASGAYAILVKWNSSGVYQWARSFNSSYGNWNGCVCDSSGNIYVAGSLRSGSDYPVLAKYNSSGTLQWQKQISAYTGTNFGRLSVDSSDNIYIDGGDPTNIGYFKFNTSGTLLFEGRIALTNLYSTNNAKLAKGANNIAAAYQYYGTPFSAFTTSFPNTAAKTGTGTIDGYTVTYTAQTPTVSTSTFTEAAYSMTTGADATSINLDTAGLLTDASFSLTYSKVTI